MLQELSFTEIMHTMGISNFNQLTIDTIEQMIHTKKIHSLYSHVKTIKEFYNLRCGPLHDIESTKEYSQLFEKKILSLKYDSLGELLETINFLSNDYTVKSELEENLSHHNQKELAQKLEFIESKLGINPQTSSPFLSQSIIKDPQTLIQFIRRWYTAQDNNQRWNPPYAPIYYTEKLDNFLKNKTTERWLNEICLQGTRYDEKHDDYGTTSGSTINTSLFLPFNGWTLAECFRQSYEQK